MMYCIKCGAKLSEIAEGFYKLYPKEKHVCRRCRKGALLKQ